MHSSYSEPGTRLRVEEAQRTVLAEGATQAPETMRRDQ